MEEAVTRVPVVRVSGAGTRRFDDEAAVEAGYLLVVDGGPAREVVLSPLDLREWAVGHLFCAGVISSAGDIAAFDERDGRIEVRTAPAARPPGRGAGTMGRTSRAVIEDAARWIAEAPLFGRTGGFHAAALLTFEGRRLALFEDIGRHNALDKVIGWGLLQEVDLGRALVVQSGRLPRDMVAKAAAAGIPLLGSVSASTDAGVSLAREEGITLVSFIREGRMNIHTHPERVRV
ncbi:MAG: formate dehydrogenase accessory sulfurtransferase FdhD [Thermovirgaceae bacterium]|nr:formate dehydrogenase accessory sulfurtransferase FdhD [Synergistales bacterium]HPC76665.1 formate dehydrogenase accessory sulfurtransferase FdhD [Synergistales bacterium]